ncbi:SAVED domain-containing protein [Pedobacter borealis]|uniref:SAVED domain-containing protein n=1 Tax=Pedobacter borealis TaxID=475254 RepID=UPI00049302D8|nr:SAVED domain-containing protein [Pedobacter borealis]
MSKTKIPESVKFRLWGKAAGRCEYDGCNKQLFFDKLTKTEFNTSYIAHIYADSENGPRYSSEYSPKLNKDISNLMLMCDEHHRLIDKEQVELHTVERLMGMKLAHETRVEMLTSIVPDKQSHIVFFGANIGQHKVPLNYKEASNAMIPHKYPSQLTAIELGLLNSVSADHDDNYWILQDEQVKEAFRQNISSLKGKHEIQHFSLFALAPIPLLVRLGTLFSDLYEVEVFQRHREPSSWNWQNDNSDCEFIITPPSKYDGIPVLKISLSGNITNDRIEQVLSDNCSIWELTIKNPHNDCLRTKEILSSFRRSARQIFNIIKQKHGQNECLHVFPAMPISAALELGRVWMPKADVPFKMYDQCRVKNQFIPTLNFN